METDGRPGMDSDVEGTPLAGPLPIELQQIAARCQRDAAAARRKSEEARVAESADDRRRRSSCGETLSVEDAATRRSSRAVKRKKFDDEISVGKPSLQLIISSVTGSPMASLMGTPSPAETPRSSETPRGKLLSMSETPRSRLQSSSESGRVRLTSSSSLPDSSIADANAVNSGQTLPKSLNGGDFDIAKEGSRAILVNGTPVLTGTKARLSNNTVIEFCNLRFVFLINTELIDAIRAEATKNHFAVTRISQPLPQSPSN